MKFTRYLAHGQVSYGIVEGDTVKEITTSPFEEYQVTDHTHKLSEIKFLPPTDPPSFLTIGGNSQSHRAAPMIQAQRVERPPWPRVYIRSNSSLIGHGDSIIRPKDAQTLHEEAELVVVIGKRCIKVSKEDALSYVLGYTCGNDLTVREWEAAGEAWKSKCCDTFFPVGPFIETDIDPGNVMIRARVNGQEVQAENSSQYIYDVPTVMKHITKYMTLMPGDIIWMGTFGTPADCNPGDTVEIDLEGIGVLSNTVKLGD